jgi:hypothetical protein
MWSLQETLILTQVVVLVASTLLNLYLFLRTRSASIWRAIAAGDADAKTAAKGLVDDLAESVDETVQQIGISRGVERDLDKRLAIVESTMGGIPSHNDLVGIRNALSRLETRLGERISAVDERSSATLNAVNRINQFLMERGK